MRENIRWWLIPSALLLAAAVALVLTYALNPFGLGDGGTALTAPAEAASRAPVAYLYVQTADGGTLRDLGNGTHALELHGVAPRSTYFSDRPEREAGTTDPADMLATVWEPDAAPPNVSLVATGADGARVTVPLELTQPMYDASAATMTFTAIPLEGMSPGLRDLELAPAGTLAGEFTDADLFIDDTFHHCVITIENYTNATYMLQSKDPPDGNRWGSGDPPEGIDGGGGVETFKYKYRSESAQKDGQLVYSDVTAPSRTMTFDWACRGEYGSVVSADFQTSPPNEHQIAITFPDGGVRFVIYDSAPLSTN